MTNWVIIAIFVLFHHSGDVAVSSQVNTWSQAECNDYAKFHAILYEEDHRLIPLSPAALPLTP